MINLTLEDFKYFSEKQALLDESIKKQKGISNDEWLYDLENNHVIALKVEIAEFVNECSDVWKYWKDEQPNRERILDEAVDVLHFVFLELNKRTNLSTEYVYERYSNVFSPRVNEVRKNEKMTEFFRIFLYEIPTLSVLATVMCILSDYGFTREDVINQYNNKNAVNFERLESGY